jgi:hypothetical protein
MILVAALRRLGRLYKTQNAQNNEQKFAKTMLNIQLLSS